MRMLYKSNVDTQEKDTSQTDKIETDDTTKSERQQMDWDFQLKRHLFYSIIAS